MRKFILFLIAFVILIMAAALVFQHYFRKSFAPVDEDIIVETTGICSPEEETKMPETFY